MCKTNENKINFFYSRNSTISGDINKPMVAGLKAHIGNKPGFMFYDLLFQNQYLI